MERYNRQMILKGFGTEGQQRLAQAKVLVVGAGGLGCPALQYLAAAGVGTIGIIDGDTISLSNLHRQTLYTPNEVNRFKAEVAAEKIRVQNPDITIQAIVKDLLPTNIFDIIAAYDIIMDGTDNFPTRYLINDACVLTQKPLVYAAIAQYEGQVGVFNAKDHRGERLNYRDLFPNPPKVGEIPNCAEAGVIGVLPGIIGTMQAAEIIKLITGIGKPLINQVLTYNLLAQETFALQVTKNPKSDALIPKNRTELEQRDYGYICSTNLTEITVDDFQNLLKKGNVSVVDVREYGEKPSIQNIEYQQIPLSVLATEFQTIKHDTVVFICQSGIRSLKAMQWLKSSTDQKQIFSLKGGINELKNTIYAERTQEN